MRLTFEKDGWLRAGPGIVRLPTVRRCLLEKGGPVAIVWHATGGACRPGHAERLAKRIQTYRSGLDRPASWHFLVSARGELFQSAPITVGTWHVGRSGTLEGQTHRNVNAATIGIELENPGRLLKVEGRFFCWPYFSNPRSPRHERRPDPRCEVPAADAVSLAGGTFFAAFGSRQEAAAMHLLEALAHELLLPHTACLYTHGQLDPSRREDPGRLFEQLVLPRMIDLVFGAEPTVAAPETRKTTEVA